MKFIDKLGALDIINLSKTYCDKWLDEIKNYNDHAEETLDGCFKRLVKESEDAKQHSLDRIRTLKDRLE